MDKDGFEDFVEVKGFRNSIRLAILCILVVAGSFIFFYMLVLGNIIGMGVGFTLAFGGISLYVKFKEKAPNEA